MEKKERPVDKIFPIERALVDIGICPICKKPIDENEFRDKLSLMEFSISGLCQNCQDEIFGIDE